MLSVVYAVYCALLAGLSHGGFPSSLAAAPGFPYLADKPVGEDGFYMLTVAWSLAGGQGLTYNYSQPTAGVQPLGTFAYAALAWLTRLFGGDRWVFVRLVLLVGGLGLLLYAHVLGKLAQALTPNPDASRVVYVLAFAFTVFNFGLFRWFTYGLETGLHLLLCGACVLLTVRWPLDNPGSARSALALGGAAALAVWGRVDFVVIFGALLSILLMRRVWKLPLILLAGIVFALALLPWLIYTHAVGGSWIPSSGAAQSSSLTWADVPVRLAAMGHAILRHLAPWMYTGTVGSSALASLPTVLAVGVLLFRARSVRVAWAAVWARSPWFARWTAAVAVLLAVYPFANSAGHFYHRYSAPMTVIYLPLLVVLVAAYLGGLRPIFQAAVQVGMAVCFFGWAAYSLHLGQIGNTHAVTAGVVQAQLAGEKVGAFQSGVIGFFNPNVVNLDGKLNQTALAFKQQGRLEDYLTAEHIDVLVDWPGTMSRFVSTAWLADNWQPCGIEIPNGITICLRRKPS